MYDSALHDVVSLEEELIKIGTFYIRKQEYIIDVEIKDPASSIDRGAVCLQLLEQEHKFQFTKIRLIEEFMEAYEHTCDIVEQQRLVQIMTDIMAKRPRLNVDATHFIDSYKSEIKYFESMTEFVKEIIQEQKITELSIISSSYLGFSKPEVQQKLAAYHGGEGTTDSMELKHRKLNEHIDRKWEYRKQDRKSEEDKINDQNLNFNESETQELEREAQEKKKRLANIAKRHITDYTKNYDQDFTEVLGLPEITADDLFKKNREKEPIVIDALRQQSRFVKIEEGFPYFSQEHILNFYEGVSVVTKIYLLINSVYEE